MLCVMCWRGWGVTDMKPTEVLFEAIYQKVKKEGVLDTNKYLCDGSWDLKLPNGVVVGARCEDAGYCHAIWVKGFLSAYLPYKKEVGYMWGDKNGILTVARMLNVD